MGALAQQARDRERHRDAVVAAAVDACRRADGPPIDSRAVGPLLDLDADGLRAPVRHHGDSIGLLLAQLLRAADDRCRRSPPRRR